MTLRDLGVNFEVHDRMASERVSVDSTVYRLKFTVELSTRFIERQLIDCSFSLSMRLRAWDDQCWSNALPLTVNSETVHSLFAFSGFRWPFLGFRWPGLPSAFSGLRFLTASLAFARFPAISVCLDCQKLKINSNEQRQSFKLKNSKNAQRAFDVFGLFVPFWRKSERLFKRSESFEKIRKTITLPTQAHSERLSLPRKELKLAVDCSTRHAAEHRAMRPFGTVIAQLYSYPLQLKRTELIKRNDLNE